MTSPREFLDNFVKPPVEEWRRDPLTEWKAKVAANALNDLAERYWNHWRVLDAVRVHGAATPGAFRRHLVAHECADFQLAWDVADAHKHTQITKRVGLLTRSDQTGAREFGMGHGMMPHGMAPHGAGIVMLVITLDDGRQREFSSVVDNVMQMWERLIP